MGKLCLCIRALTSTTAEWRKMRKVWEACEVADVPIPVKVMEYFRENDAIPPLKDGGSVFLHTDGKLPHTCLSGYDDGPQREGWYIDMAALPKCTHSLLVYIDYSQAEI